MLFSSSFSSQKRRGCAAILWAISKLTTLGAQEYCMQHQLKYVKCPLFPLCRNPVVPRLRSLREDSGQSNGVLLTVEIRIKLVPWLVFQSACYRILRMVTAKIMSFAVGEKVIIFLSNFFWQKLVFSWFFSTSFSSYVCTSTCLILILPGVLQIIFCTGFSLS